HWAASMRPGVSLIRCDIAVYPLCTPYCAISFYSNQPSHLCTPSETRIKPCFGGFLSTSINAEKTQLLRTCNAKVISSIPIAGTRHSNKTPTRKGWRFAFGAAQRSPPCSAIRLQHRTGQAKTGDLGRQACGLFV